jgi:polyisoprenoid-binding protein YceI
MKRVCLFVGALFAAGLIVAGAARPVESRISAPGTSPEAFTIDPVHSTVIFRIDHMGVAPFYGRFSDISGEFTFDESDPAAATFNITIRAAGVDSGNEQRDRHLQSADFFNAREHPEITFRSTAVTAGEDGALEVKGDLTLHGVTNPVTVKVTPGGAVEAQGAFKRGFSAEATIKRSEFGMNYGLQGSALGDEVTLMIGLEGARK